ncbi:putative ammonium transporter 3 isoform X2 [Portunus trituberculatus]|uniref:putative ammonium transporter 3 isoform X2 n=1 Tax=Portunus trituberculatus TaxID=210409 RepID=UPI001E1D0214|nr:putative ammonium transporter 3 isoform X2 [Portunus trituberculatus]
MEETPACCDSPTPLPTTTSPPPPPQEPNVLYSLDSSQLMEEIANLSRQLLQDDNKETIALANSILNLTGNLLPVNGSLSIIGDLNVTDNENATQSTLLVNASFISNATSRGGGVQFEGDDGFGNDAAWILTATFIIFTMQSGFGLLESGCVSMKNETNIMVKNVVDVVLGGFTYWLFGYSLSFGKSEWTNPFCGWGDFAINPDESSMGRVYTTFFFQMSFATTATTIVSGAIAERFNFVAYVIFSAVNTIVYCIPAGWIWAEHGFLFQLGVVDIAGSCGVHLCGGASALVASKMVGPRIGRYDDGEASLPMGSPTNAILGMFMLWWGWLGFNCGSTFGINGHLWKYAARTAVTTLQSSIGGGLAGMSFSWYKNHRLEVGDVVNSVLGALVSVTAGCALFTSWEALFIGLVGGLIAVLGMPIFDKLHIDDPVGAVAVHGLCGIWAMVSIGLFVQADSLQQMTSGYSGLFRGGGFYLLGIQSLACLCIIVWSMSATFIILFAIDKFFMGIRMSEWEELVGADFAEHGIRRRNVGVSRAVSVLGLQHNGFDYSDILPQGDNPCHVKVLGNLDMLSSRRGSTLSKAVAQVTTKSFKTKLLPSFLLNGKSKDSKDRKEGNEFFNSNQVTPLDNPNTLSAWQ